MKIKKLFFICMAIVFIVSMCKTFVFAESTTSNECNLGYIPDSGDFSDYSSDLPMTMSVLPDSVDLSDSIYFPPIGNQHSLGSCGSFATTYYQFSYEVNKLNNISSVNDRVVYSPKWTYNLINSGRGFNTGTTFEQNYTILENFGCLDNETFSYTGNINDFEELPANLESEKIEALSTRVVDYNSYAISNNSNISSPSSTALNNIKSLLNQGKMLVAGTKCYFNSKSVNNECIVYRCTPNPGGNHAVTIVGYDDNKYCDVNGNGVIEECEKGAFKVANSWGTSYSAYGSFSNNGFFWVLYDSLNYISTNIYNDWESKLSGTRYPTFSMSNNSSGNNIFYSIEVAHKDVNLIGELNVNTANRESLILKINRTNSNVTSWTTTGSTTLYPFDGSGTSGIAFNGILVFDYDSYAEPISSYLTGYNWHTCLEGTNASETQAAFRIVDSKGNSVTNYKSLTGSTLSAYHNLSLQKGDVNYDGAVTSDDSNLIMNYVAMIIKLSDLQYYLADYNNNGDVDVSDVVAINMSLLSTASLSELIKINAVNTRVQEYCISNDLGVDIYES